MNKPLIRDLLRVFKDGRERTVNDVTVRLKCSEDVARDLLGMAVKQGALIQDSLHTERKNIQTWKAA